MNFTLYLVRLVVPLSIVFFIMLYYHSTELLPRYFFNSYLAAPRPTLGHYQGGSLTHPMLITCVLHI